MSVRCASCGGYNATLRMSVAVSGDSPDESAVCVECAGRIERQALGEVGPLAPHELLGRLMADPEDPTFRCPVCGYDVENLVRTGKLGCLQCYYSFMDEVMNLIRRSFGRDAHRGKMPPPRLESADEEED